jgi:Phage integrase family
MKDRVEMLAAQATPGDCRCRAGSVSRTSKMSATNVVSSAAWWLRLRLRVGSLWVDYGLVFPSAVGTPQDARNLRKSFRSLAAEVAWPGSFHSIRRYYASRAVATAPDVVVAKLLGHARTSMTTDTYAHLRNSDADRVALLSALLSWRATRERLRRSGAPGGTRTLNQPGPAGGSAVVRRGSVIACGATNIGHGGT